MRNGENFRVNVTFFDAPEQKVMYVESREKRKTSASGSDLKWI